MIVSICIIIKRHCLLRIYLHTHQTYENAHYLAVNFYSLLQSSNDNQSTDEEVLFELLEESLVTLSKIRSLYSNPQAVL